MSNSNFFNCITVDANLPVPKYLQVADSITDSIKRGRIQKNQYVPSISELEINLEISRGTAERCYRHLRLAGILSSVPGKGFYVNAPVYEKPIRVFLMLNALNEQKNKLYEAFVETIGSNAMTDIFVYNDSVAQFAKAIENRKDYDYYVILPPSADQCDFPLHILQMIPRNKLVVIGTAVDGMDGKYAAVTENYEQVVFRALMQVLQRLKRYHTIKIILPKNHVFPAGILKGFKRFCICHNFKNEALETTNVLEIQAGVVYITLVEEDLITLVQMITCSGLMAGEQVGLITYNDSPYNRIILNGITTIATDFRQMGAIAAQLVSDRSTDHIEAPSSIFVRGSL